VVNNVAVMSDVAPGYAPPDKALISVSVLGEDRRNNLIEVVQKELRGWFGEEVFGWKHLRTDLIKEALPTQTETNPVGVREIDGILICGDHAVSASIEGAISSGKSAAAAVLATS
jgi:predicted NAD/FAD-dependent oxidoreductase